MSQLGEHQPLRLTSFPHTVSDQVVPRSRGYVDLQGVHTRDRHLERGLRPR